MTICHVRKQTILNEHKQFGCDTGERQIKRQLSNFKLHWDKYINIKEEFFVRFGLVVLGWLREGVPESAHLCQGNHKKMTVIWRTVVQLTWPVKIFSHFVLLMNSVICRRNWFLGSILGLLKSLKIRTLPPPTPSSHSLPPSPSTRRFFVCFFNLS